MFNLIGILLYRSIRNCGREIQNIAGCYNNIPLCKGSTVSINLLNDRFFSIIYCIRVVNSKVVDVVSIRSIDRTIGLPKDIIDCLVEDNGNEELTICTCFIILGELLRICKCNLFICTDIHFKVMPTGFINVVVNIFGIHHVDGSSRIQNAVAG